MRLNWNEIRARAAAFAREWDGKGYEKGETHTFYNEFFDVFGVPRKRVASFEEPVKLLGAKRGFIDLFWKGVLLVEQKSAGRSLSKAKQQAFDYFPGLKDAELPRFLLLSDFQTFELYDLEEGDNDSFALAELPEYVEAFGFILGVQKRAFRDQDPVNIRAAELVAKIHDGLEASGYTGHNLEQFLVRLVFCFFADDTGIFDPRDLFLDFLKDRTRPDGSDLGGWLSQLFQTLDTPETDRPTILDEDLARFPYINGDLFRDALRIPSFNSGMRKDLIEACEFNWSVISPAIFGSLFQSVMNKDERRQQGAHYTTEKNILKVIHPLFLDELRAEFERVKARKDTRRRSELLAFNKRLGGLKFFDPACGCGNFLVITYREIRLLELEVIREIIDYERGPSGEFTGVLDVATFSLVNVDQFYGIEVGEFPARIAEAAMWMMDHIMNNRLSLEFGRSYLRIPLKKSPHIQIGNALAADWTALLPPQDCAYVLGNPPFRGHQWRSKKQQADMARIWGRSGQVNRLDYVTCWFRNAVDYAKQNQKIRIGFVSTNSITQGEQSGILWPYLFHQGVTIAFAHRTFQWNSEARGKAAVHCVIIGMALEEPAKRIIYDYGHVRGEPHAAEVARINGYLVDGPQYTVPARSKPRPGFLKMHKGSQPTDGARLKSEEGGYETFSNLILDEEQRAELLAADPKAKKWLRPYVGGDELISGKWRWCLWLKGADPAALKVSQPVLERLERVRAGRLRSPTASVRAFARYPSLFTQDRQPSIPYLAVPEVSSETREYIPIAILEPSIIASNKLQIIPGAPLWYFGVLTSAMHMAWMRTVGGRLESRYSYAPAIYNSFPWPVMTDADKHRITELAQGILNARALFLSSTLEVLYDIDTMPPELRRAHDMLDKAIDRLYRRAPFEFERDRVQHLFQVYETLDTPLTAGPARAAARRRRSDARRE